MRMTDWNLIQTLYECRSLTKAASLLYLTQPTLTKRLQAIEEELGVTIAVRGKQGVSFTPEGEYLAVKAVQFNNMMQEVKEHLISFSSQPGGVLTLGAPNSMARFAIPELLQEYRRLRPGVQFDFITTQSSHVCRLVEQGKADLGFINGEIPFQGKRLLYKTEQAYIASSEALDMDHLEKYTYITYIKDSYTQQIIEQWWNEHYYTPLPRGLTVRHADICKEMILKGLGYTVFFAWDYMADYPQFIHPLCHRDGSPLLRNTWLIYTENSIRKPQVDDFIRCITAHAAAAPELSLNPPGSQPGAD
ncbi:LysR family transcriptional regulator [Clostridium sp. AN503]|uniref:LysR family transcriptional regulator n=1 Tax=Clostridium sp. AN503 TaxID=3160598 RepID=UPI0034595DCD